MTKIQHRRDIATNWTTANPVLSAGEIGVELDTLKFKIGDGATTWVDLKYQSEDIDLSNYVTKDDLDNISVKTDNATITQNSDKVISAIGVKDKNGNNDIYAWSGTEAQYNADLANGKITPETICNITDDEEDLIIPDMSNYYTKSEVEALIKKAIEDYKSSI